MAKKKPFKNHQIFIFLVFLQKYSPSCEFHPKTKKEKKSSYWICLEIQTLMICPFFLKSSKLKHDFKYFTKTFSYVYMYKC
jgi:hypothetical protein